MPLGEQDFKIISVKTPCTFRELCDDKGLPYAQGSGFYELKKKESISANKVLAAAEEDTGEFVTGTSKVREKLGLSEGAISVGPKDVPHGWTLYIQSTSPNRKLPAGATALILLGSGNGGGGKQAAAPAPKKAAKATPKASKRGRSTKEDDSDEDEKSEEKVDKAVPPSKKPKATAPTASAPSGKWSWEGTLMYKMDPGSKDSAKIAAFDYDGCLAKTSLFKKGPDAWSVLFPGKTEAALREFHSAGYRLVIMTNQAQIGKAKASYEKTVAEKVGRLEGFVKAVGLPMDILVATADTKVADKYRKPASGMWEFIEGKNAVEVDRKRSVFVGDAAGRKGDHSDSDKKFAQGVGVKFFTEKEFFVEGACKPL